MHDIKKFIEETDYVKKNLEKRSVDVSKVDEVVSLNVKRKELITSSESLKAEINKLSKEIGILKKEKKDADQLMKQVANIKEKMKVQEIELEEIQKKQKEILETLPNLIADDVPVGKDETSNLELKKVGQPREFNFKVKDHVELGENLGMLDFERGAKVTGARFTFYKGAIARLERALYNFMLDTHIKTGHQEIIPPYIVNASSMYGTGQLPKFREDLFHLENFDWFLIPTAEVPVTNYRAQEIMNLDELPLKFCAFTPCFRSEAGSAGKDTKGLIRLHQFQKVELVYITNNKKSDEAHEQMINSACSILDALKLPYRAVLLCSGDIGFGARKCVDLEVWLPGQNTYREISSISNCGDFQARRAGIRYRNEEGKPEFAHTLNGSGLAVGRTVVAVMENYQNEDGSITVPEVLRPYMGGLEKIER